MGKGRLVVAGAVAALAAMAIAACGSSNSNSADEDQITNAINAAATSGDPAACTKYQTLKFTEQTSGGKGQEAVHSCERDAANSVADKVDVTDISVSGDTATAKADFTGSNTIFDGQTLDLALAKEGGQWKLDEFKGFVDFNRAAFLAAFPKELAKEPGTNPQGISCVTQQLQSVSDQVIESSFVGNNRQLEQQTFGPCQQYFKG